MLCKYWEQGLCKNSETCTYAHGESDLISFGNKASNIDINKKEEKEEVNLKFDPLLLCYQLNHITNRLFEVYSPDPNLAKYLSESINYLSRNDYEKSAEILHVY